MPDWINVFVANGSLPFIATGGLLGWIKFFLERRDKRLAEQKARESEEARKAEQRARITSETELKAAKRRAPNAAPYLVPSNQLVNGIEIVADRNGSRAWIPGGFPQFLDAQNSEVPRDTRANEPVYLLLENKGAAATEVFLDIDGCEATLEADHHHRNPMGLMAMVYCYNPEKHGQRQAVTMRFMAPDGFRDTHKYELIHGKKWLRRIDPA